MRKSVFVLFASVLLAGIVRGTGFADFDRRAQAGEDLTVVFFGGSLTWSANASDPNVTGFRGLMADYLRERYPLARFRFHDAAIGGTGSLLGAFRLERDVLSHHPDLVFLDFLCNDGTDETNLDATCAYEYILRELIGRGIPVEQMFFTFKFWAGKDFDPVKSLPRRNFYHRLAEAYGTPFGDVQLEALGRDLVSGKTTLDEVWPLDGAHPCDFGYRYFFEAVKAGYERGVAEKAVCRVPGKPVYGTMRDVRRTRIVDGGLPEGWTRQLTFRTSMWYDGLSSRWMGDVAVATPKAASLSFDATCNYIGFFGEGDENGLSFELSDENGTLETFRSSPGHGRLFFFRRHLLPEWEKGAKAHRFAVKPVAAEKGDLRIESVLTATLVPTDPAAGAIGRNAKDSVEALDHARGKKDVAPVCRPPKMQDRKAAFERTCEKPLESAKLTFVGADGWDVYNCSIPFTWNGVRYIFGRLEKHEIWTQSHIALFRETAKDVWTKEPAFAELELEDPYVQTVKGELIVGGTFIRRDKDGKFLTYQGRFYRGKDPFSLVHFADGPDKMKDIRMTELPNGRIGVFSRPRGEEVRAKWGSEAVVGYAEIASLDEFTADLVQNAPIIPGLFGKDEWGGVNQAYALKDGRILAAAHLSCGGAPATNGIPRQIYMNASFVFDPKTFTATEPKIVATRCFYPANEPKVPHLDDCVFTSGFVFRKDGLVDVYTGLCDADEARCAIRSEAIGVCRCQLLRPIE